MTFTLNKANSYIKENKSKVNPYYKGIYHFQPEIGWINDPNGLVYFNDEFYLFYQYYPYDTKPGPMHWGLATSKDLLTFDYKDVYLAPTNQDVVSGCFSGSSIVVDNKLFISYTAHYEKEGYRREEQFLFAQNDKENIIKIVADEELPEGCDTSDFRDPHIIYKNGYYYLLVGSRNHKLDEGVLLIFRSETLSNFKYHFSIYSKKEFGIMCECPDYFESNGYDVLICSAVRVRGEENEYKNDNGTSVLVGHIDFENKTYEFTFKKELDKGDGFYAPKLIQNYNETIMIAWMETWGKDIPTQHNNHLWAGAFTYPRKLEVRNGELYQYPIENIKKIYSKTFSLNENNIIKRNADIFAKYHCDFELIFKGQNNDYDVKITAKHGYIYLNTKNSNNLNGFERRLVNTYENVDLRILLDSSSIEIFVNEGREAISTRIYLESDKYEVVSSEYESFVINEI